MSATRTLKLDVDTAAARALVSVLHANQGAEVVAIRANLTQSEKNRWKAKQRTPREILGKHRSGGRFVL